jgi:hypothetical protein
MTLNDSNNSEVASQQNTFKIGNEKGNAVKVIDEIAKVGDLIDKLELRETFRSVEVGYQSIYDG